MGENCHFVSLWVILQAQNVRKFFECVGLLKGEFTGTLRALLYFLRWQRYLPWSLQGDNNTYKGHKQNRKAEVGARVFTRNTDCTILKRVIQMVLKKIVLRNGNSSSLPPCHFFRVPSLLAVHLSSQAPPVGEGAAGQNWNSLGSKQAFKKKFRTEKRPFSSHQSEDLGTQEFCWVPQ